MVLLECSLYEVFEPLLKSPHVDVLSMCCDMVQRIIEEEVVTVSNRKSLFYMRRDDLPYWEEIDAETCHHYIMFVLQNIISYIDARVKMFIADIRDEPRVGAIYKHYKEFVKNIYRSPLVSKEISRIYHKKYPYTYESLFVKHNIVAFRNKVAVLQDGDIVWREASYDDNILHFVDYDLCEREEVVEEMKEMESLFKDILDTDERYVFMMTWMAHRMFNKEVDSSRIINCIGDDCSGRPLFVDLMYEAFGRYSVSRVHYKLCDEKTQMDVSEITDGECYVFESRKSLSCDTSDDSRLVTPINFPNSSFADCIRDYCGKVTVKQQSAIVHLLLNFAHLPLLPYDADIANSTTTNSLPHQLHTIFNRFVSVHRYNDSIGFVPLKGQLLSKIHPSALMYKVVDVLNIVNIVLLSECSHPKRLTLTELQKYMKINTNMKSLCDPRNRLKDSSRKNLYNCVYPDYAAAGVPEGWS